jgi:AraC-like DNA-binding protein
LLNGHSIFDTALRCGFADVPAFSKAFKQAFGQSPGTLQKSNS